MRAGSALEQAGSPRASLLRRPQYCGSPIRSEGLCGSPGSKPLEPHRPSAQLSLQEIAWRVVKDHITTSNVLDLIDFARQLNMPMDMHEHCMRYIRRAYLILRERRSRDDLAAVLEPELLESLEAAVVEDERLAHERKVFLGRVVEAPQPDCPPQVGVPSVAGHAESYPYAALVGGVSWPPAVDPSARERHMSESEFLAVFGMSYPAYQALPAWKQRVLKQDKRLF